MRPNSFIAFLLLAGASTLVAQPKAGPESADPPTTPFTIAADSSLRGAISELTQEWADNQDTHPTVELAITNADGLRKKLVAGSGWDVVISASEADLKDWADKGRIQANTKKYVTGNQLAILGKKPLVPDDEWEWFDLATKEWSRIAIGDPLFTSSGVAARKAMEGRKIFTAVEKSLIVSPTEVQAIETVLRNEADAAMVYQSDLAKVKIPGFQVIPVDPGDYPAVLYGACVVADSKRQAMAKDFISFLVTEDARAVWKKWGFKVD